MKKELDKGEDSFELVAGKKPTRSAAQEEVNRGILKARQGYRLDNAKGGKDVADDWVGEQHGVVVGGTRLEKGPPRGPPQFQLSEKPQKSR